MLIRATRLIATILVAAALLWLYIDTHTRVIESAAAPDWDDYHDALSSLR